MALFESSEVTRKPPPSLLPKCGACGLHLGCRSPKMPVTGDGRMGVLVVAEAPGADEDARNEQLVGRAGQELRRTLHSIDIDLDRDCWKTSALICRPPEDRTPTNDEVDYCRPNLLAVIRELQPKVVIVLGGPAIRSVLGPHWKDDVGSVAQWVGWNVPLHEPNMWVAPTYHPSYVVREEGNPIGPVVKLWFRRHLQAAFELASGGRPWVVAPNYEKKVQLLYNPEDAARHIRSYIERGGAVAVDYETDRLKPDADDAEIVSCALCWRGQETIAYPFVGVAATATGELLRSPLPKIMANNPFEDRWTRRMFGHPVNNWSWDCVLSAHHLDCRKDITSVKFQAFVRLGQTPWDFQVRPYMEGDGSNDRNRVRQIDTRTLLLYNGMDALLEYWVACIQRAEMMQQDTEPIRLRSAQ